MVIRVSLAAMLLTITLVFSAWADSPCKECHDDHFEAKVPHYPAQDGSCDFCHDATPAHLSGDDYKAVVTNRSQETCYNCHEPMDSKPNLHGALQTGEDSCIGCHNPHGSQNISILRRKMSETCGECHELSEMQKGVSVHGILNSERSCAHCHNPHSSSEAKHLNKPLGELCLSCHDKPIPLKDRVLPNIKAKIEQPFRKEIATECNSCHLPHASKNFGRLLINAFPAKNYGPYNPGDATVANTYGLCFECHDMGLLNRKMTSTETRFRNDSKSGERIYRVNLHWFHVTNESSSTGPRFGRSCRICHDIHGSPQEHLIKTDISAGAPTLKFTATETGGTCAGSCHNVKTYQRLN